MRSLRVRLLVWPSLALCTLWGAVAAWMFADMRHELRSVLDDRLIASARMVAGIVHQFKPQNASPEDWGPMLNVVARDGVACEVSMIRSEVQTAPAPGVDAAVAQAAGDKATGKGAVRQALIPASPLEVPRFRAARTGDAGPGATAAPGQEIEPDDPQVLARTAGAPSFQGALPLGFSSITKGGKPWRTYVLEEHGVRIATADRIDVREGLIHGFAYTIILPFVLALLASMVLMGWGVTRGLRPLESLRQELSQRPPGDDSPVVQGRQVRELAPLVLTINHLLQRVHRAIERERRWSDDAAHELRTPLTAVKTHVQVAQMAVAHAGSQMVTMPEPSQAGNPDVAPTPVSETTQWQMTRQALEQAGQGVEHLQHTLEQLLLLARLDCQPAGEEDGESLAMACGSEPACAWESLEKAWELAATAIPSGSQHMGWLPGQDLGDASLQDLRVALPQPLLVSALRNLTENALRHGQPVNGRSGDSSVLLGLRHVSQLAKATPAHPAGYVEFTVLDHGPGLSREDCHVATQRFWRRQHQAHGSGLGLAIVQRIAQCSGGELELLSRAQWLQEHGRADPGATGLVVRLCLPVKPCPVSSV